MIEFILLFIFSVFPFAVAGLIAGLIVMIVSKVVDKKEREERRATHMAQAASDMHEMQKVYTNLLFYQIMKGN